MKIFKYTLSPTDKQTILIPSPARILSVAEQRNNIVHRAKVMRYYNR